MTGMERLIDCAAVRDHVESASVLLAQWAYRDDSKPQADLRRAGGNALNAVDDALAELYRIRQRLASEIHASDEASIARAEALLAQYRVERGQQ